MEGAHAALTEAEAAAVAAEAAHNVARAEMETARATLAESEKRVQRLETEGKPCRRCCRWRPAVFGRRLSTTSPSKKGTRKRLAPPWATIWTLRLTHPRQCIGARLRTRPATLLCPTAWRLWSNTSKHPHNWRGGSHKLELSNAMRRSELPVPSRPASGWCHAKATSGAGMVSLRPRTLQQAPLEDWRSAAGLPRSTRNSKAPQRS